MPQPLSILYRPIAAQVQAQGCQRKPIYLRPESQVDVPQLCSLCLIMVLSTCLHNVFLSLPICAFIKGVSSDSEYLSL